MLIIQKLETFDNFTTNEQTVAKYLIDNYNSIKKISITQIAKTTFTSPSTLVRLCKKCGYNGWRELKLDLLEEMNYIDSHFHSINPNLPFSSNDNSIEVIKSITALLSDTINDTFNLLDLPSLCKSVDLIDQASIIYIYGLEHAIAPVYDFMYKMQNIGKRVVIIKDIDAFKYCVHHDPHIIHICVSYSGETIALNDFVKKIRLLGATVIGITSIGGNTLSRIVDYMIPICTREKLFSKIATYTSNESIHYIFDLIYSLIFHKHYDKYLNYKIELARHLDFDRISNVNILDEKINQ